MSILVALSHKTEYLYDRPVSLAPHVVRLRPCAHTRIDITAYSLTVHPAKHFINWQQDPFGNFLARLVFPEKTRELRIEVDLQASLKVMNPFDFFLEDYAEKFPFTYPPSLAMELHPFLVHTDNSPLLDEYFASLDKTPDQMVLFLNRLVRQVASDIGYLIRMEPGVQSCQQTLEKRSGSCRDSSFLFIQILRRMGLAARFTSGYLIQLRPDNRQSDADGPASDFTDLHAWAEVYLPGAGWVGLDPTSGLFAGEGHIPLAATPEPGSAAPISGLSDASGVEFHFEMHVKRLQEKPRSTRPYSDEVWQNIQRAGHEIEEQQQKMGLAYTMGGEPTFAALNNRDAPEWNTVAIGPHKQELAHKFIKILKRHFAPQGVLQFTQGKWYPGEFLPRFSYNCYNIADYQFFQPDISGQDCSIEKAEAFALSFARELDLPERFVLSAREDMEYYSWKAAIEKFGDLSDFEKAERARALGLKESESQVAGFVLPLQYNLELERWQSCQWKFSRGDLFAIPGDSAIGYRLPLDSIEKAEDALPVTNNTFHILPDVAEALNKSGPAEAALVVRTAICFEARNQKLFIFLPPLGRLEEWVGLLEAAGRVSEKLGLHYILEGYEPPSDHRLQVLKVTPDPGVIEVNIPPVKSWQEALSNTLELYRAAQECDLTAEKYLLDGRISGTGGGNHITLGAEVPADSPFFKKPALLRRLVSYWQHHPALSYLFSSLFIGPTSQAPRVDEVRDATLFELDLALLQIDRLTADNQAPWKLDRLLRNFLVDLTGNTHRAEICIDKLYSPDSATGRLGLVELRGFEMPPHAEMNLAQQLLIRAIVLRLYKSPYDWPLEHRGTRLHDQFMLPYFIWQDFKKIILDLKLHGMVLEEEWFLPFYEFRFPEYGRARVGDVQLELRQALEPWNVLGETVFQSGTARPVDSAIERVQLTLSNFEPARQSLVCNGFIVPVHETDRRGEYIAGVRFKAWLPAFTLHPYIPLQSPLQFEIYDRQLERSTGGFRYYVSHPGGRSYDSMPVNHNEAESRRASRFLKTGYSTEKSPAPRLVRTRSYFTFDLLEAWTRAQ